MELQVRCKVFPGQFSNEYAVTGEQAHGDRFSLFAPVGAVDAEQAPSREAAVDGWLKVMLWKRAESTAIVQLPRESFESGRFVTVSASQVKVWPDPVGANP